MIRVLLAEDQAMVRGALSALLSLEEDIEVIAEVGRGDEVVLVARSVQPDVALLDIEMPGGGGLSAAQALHECLPSCRVVILTTFGRSGFLRRAMEGGAVGFLLKDAPADDLPDAIRLLAAGTFVCETELIRHILTRLSQWATYSDEARNGEQLSIREGEVLISPEVLRKDGLLTRGDLDTGRFSVDRVDFARVRQVKGDLLTRAYDRFARNRHRISAALGLASCRVPRDPPRTT